MRRRVSNWLFEFIGPQIARLIHYKILGYLRMQHALGAIPWIPGACPSGNGDGKQVWRDEPLTPEEFIANRNLARQLLASEPVSDSLHPFGK
jgi:hypothetical protein